MMDHNKKQLRKQMAIASQISPKQLQQESTSIIQRVLSLPFVLETKGIAIFLSSPLEIQTISLIETLLLRNVNVYVPQVITINPPTMHMVQVTSMEQMQDFVANQWGISEPVITTTSVIATPLDLDVIIVPGVAFDATCARCGHGKGFYDRFIAETIRVQKSAGKQQLPVLIGLALTHQIVEAVPMMEHDYYMTYVVTPTGIFAQESEVTGDGSSDNDVDNKQSESVRASDINVPLFTSNFLRNDDVKNNKNTTRASKPPPPPLVPKQGRRSASFPSKSNRNRVKQNIPDRRCSVGLHNLWAELAYSHESKAAGK